MWQAIIGAFTGAVDIYMKHAEGSRAESEKRRQEALLQEQIIAQRNYDNKKLQEYTLMGVIIVFIILIIYITIKNK